MRTKNIDCLKNKNTYLKFTPNEFLMCIYQTGPMSCTDITYTTHSEISLKILHMGRHLEGQFFAMPNTIKNQDIYKTQMLVQC